MSQTRKELEDEVAHLRHERDEHARVRWEQATEIISLRQQVATLIAGQQSAGEARQQAFIEFAEDLAAMTPADRDSAIRRIIDQGDNQ
jgi:hypothetical protein